MWLKLLLIILSMDLTAMNTEIQLKCPNQPVKGNEGDSVILPCSLNANITRVEWVYVVYHDGEENPVEVHLYRQEEDDFKNQGEQYKGRTSLFHQELSSGNYSLQLTNLTTNDSRTYWCKVKMKEKDDPYSCNMNLTVHVSQKALIKTTHQDPQVVSPKTTRWHQRWHCLWLWHCHSVLW